MSITCRHVLSRGRADDLAAAADRHSEEIKSLDNLCSAHFADWGLDELGEILPDARRGLDYLVAVLARRFSTFEFPDRDTGCVEADLSHFE
jgi:hypothetical protein